MTVDELAKELERIMEVHPDARNSVVWVASDHHKVSFRVEYIGFTTRRKPHRLTLED